jgi:hypothetical protein
MKKYPLFLFAVVLAISFNACKKSTEEFKTDSISDYNPLVVGKYIVYNLDSIVFINFGASSVVHSYQVKYETDGEMTDAQGRPAFRIIRYIRNSPSNAWAPDNTFMAVNTTQSLEFIENNLRFIKLKLPIRDNYSWKGNSFIDTYSANSELKYMDDWDYMYDSVGVQNTVGNYTLDNCLVVNQSDRVDGFPDDPALYSEINYSQEKYAKGIGMVYRKFFHSEYQPPVPGQGGFIVTGSYGITLTMIDHN